MPLDFEALRKETIDPGANVGETLHHRRATLDRLYEIGISHSVLAVTCAVDPRTIRAWQSGPQSPGRDTGRRALDRLGPIIQHMEEDLGLTDAAIAEFLLETPERPENNDPLFETFAGIPLITQVGAHTGPVDGVEAVQARLEARFPERQVYEQAGVIATPETVA